MDEQVRETLSEIELRLSALESRQAQAEASGGGKKGTEEKQEFIGSFVWIPIPIAVFAWLSGGSTMAWTAVGFIGVACVAAAVLLVVRRS